MREESVRFYGARCMLSGRGVRRLARSADRNDPINARGGKLIAAGDTAASQAFLSK
jgi:hypothetical protein